MIVKLYSLFVFLSFPFFYTHTVQQKMDDPVDLIPEILSSDSFGIVNYSRKCENEIIVLKESIFARESCKTWNGVVVRYLTWAEIISYVGKSEREHLLLMCDQVLLNKENIKFRIVLGLIEPRSLKARAMGKPFIGVLSTDYFEYKF